MTDTMLSLAVAAIGLFAAPLMTGAANRIKALVAGRRGAPLLQIYYDIWKLMRRGAVYSTATTWLFRLGPVVGLAATLIALALTPVGGIAAPLSFAGDIVLLAGLLALARFATMLAALDTGSSFEGMGASREAHFAALAEPALLLEFAGIVRVTGETSLSSAYAAITPALWAAMAPVILLVAATLMCVFLVENARIPVDDPTTHLELTMIHEVMVLDHSGPDLAMIHYGAALKTWILGLLLVGPLVPVRSGVPWIDIGAMLGGMALLAVVLGLIESAMARLSLTHVPDFIIGAAAFSVVAFILTLG